MAPPIQFGLGLSLARAGGAALDPDAKAYIAAVEFEDGQALESGVRKAFNNFVVGCKVDGIWSAIKASCILAGARTLDGALVPLVGTAPTNNNFVSGDYNRETGLIGNGSTKYLNSNRNNNADPQNNRHLAINITDNGSGFSSLLIGCGASLDVGRSAIARVYAQGDFFRLSNGAISNLPSINSGFVAATRSLSASFVARTGGSNTTFSQTSETPKNEDIGVFARIDNSGHSNARLSFYSIGESLDLALLDTRVSTLMTDLAAAIP
jgi:hypothetical protein